MREIVKGSSTIFIETHSNQHKCFVHIPKCSTEASSMSQMIKYKFVREIINILGGGVENVVGGCTKGHYGFVGECKTCSALSLLTLRLVLG